MRPLNTRERRIQFTRFVLLFALAVLPIVVLVWMIGRVDHMENDYLRAHYVANEVDAESNAKRKELYAAVQLHAQTLNDMIANKTEDMKTFGKGTNMSANINNQLKKLDTAIDNLRRSLSGSAEDSLYLGIMDLSQSLHDASFNLNGVYGAAFESITTTSAGLAAEEKTSEKLRKALNKCNAMLMPGQQVDPELQ